MIKYRKFGVLTLSLMILSVFAVLSVSALSEENDSIEDVPDLPLVLHGGLDINGEPVSAGSEILAYYEGKLIAKSIVEEEGKYSLSLNLPPENYTNIGEVEFYVNGNIASFNISASEIEAIKNNTPGSITEVDLKGSVSSTEGDSSSGNGDGTGEARIVKKDSASFENSTSSENSTESENSEDDSKGVKESSDMQEPVSQEGDEGGEDASEAGYSTFFTGLLFITALFGALLIIKR